MKRALAACFLTFAASPSRAGEVILPYSAFGPQAAAYELIGMEWWQWDSHGDERDQDYPIKVVVFWNRTRKEIAKRHPLDRAKLQDFRYVEYARAVPHMQRVLKEFKNARLDASSIERGLAQLENEYKADQGDTGQ